MERINVSADSTASADLTPDRAGAVKWFVKGLDLNQHQLDQLSEILQETRAAYKEHELQIESIKQHSRVRIREILTDEQKLTYDQLLADRARKEREKEARTSR
jgi:Spy/CpxP family protein refolding chaperone